jgi:predicted ribosome quality control (RQC) complex YloA/Tae2 family protein
VILTDNEYKILTLLRPYKSEEDSVVVAVGQTYPVNNFKKLELPNESKLQELLKSNPDSNLKELLTQNFRMCCVCCVCVCVKIQKIGQLTLLNDNMKF